MKIKKTSLIGVILALMLVLLLTVVVLATSANNGSYSVFASYEITTETEEADINNYLQNLKNAQEYLFSNGIRSKVDRTDNAVLLKIKKQNIFDNDFITEKLLLALSENSSGENYSNVENATIAKQSDLNIYSDNYSQIETVTTAKQHGIENSLLDFEMIDGAQVTLNFENEVNSASIVLATNRVVGDSEIDKIVLFLSKSVENLAEENIQITDQATNMIYPKS